MKNRKRVLILAAALLICLCICFAAPVLLQFPVIGRVYGAENEYIEIDGKVFVRTMDHEYTSLDRERYIGAVKNEAMTMRVFTVEGDDSGDFLFTLWDWEGYFYVRQSQ